MGETKRILIIDDEPATLDLLKRVLESAGYEAVLAANGREGVDKFQQRPCDLVVTDMVMPEKDGLQTILDLRLDVFAHGQLYVALSRVRERGSICILVAPARILFAASAMPGGSGICFVSPFGLISMFIGDQVILLFVCCLRLY